MHFHSYLFAIIAGSAAAKDVQRRGFSFRPGRVADDAPIPAPPTPYRPHSGSASGITDDALEEASPEYLPASRPNECLHGGCAELTVELAKQVVEAMLDMNQESSSTTRRAMGTQGQGPLVTAYASASPIPNYDVAKTMTLVQEDLALFNREEQDMYFNDRMCFYANIERKYASVATASPTHTQVARRRGIGEDIQSDLAAAPATTSLSTLAAHDAEWNQEWLWRSWMPGNILSIYSPVAANGSTTTATTTCSGLGDSAPITMSYVQARVSSHSPTPTSNVNMVTGAGNAHSGARGSAVFAAVVALAGVAVL